MFAFIVFVPSGALVVFQTKASSFELPAFTETLRVSATIPFIEKVKEEVSSKVPLFSTITFTVVIVPL
ncbi:MAG: hypothetical protein ACD_79C00110G0001 [uncultured bacterium]|nr:MAG: hypothetical protein ACD_79C00110G0001 [uncultured bacterium]